MSRFITMFMKEKAYDRIDRDYDTHLERTTDFLRRPSISPPIGAW